MSIFFRDFITLSKEVSKALRNTGYWPDINGESSRSINAEKSTSGAAHTETNGSSTGSSMDEPQPGPSGLQEKSNTSTLKDSANIEQYKKAMKDYQIDTCEFSMSGHNAHAFSNAFTKAGMPSSSIIFRVAQELSSLSTSLPLDFSSGIFLRTDDDKPTLMKVLITG